MAVWLSEHLLGATFTVECEDASSVDGKRGYVIVCNHQSSLDAGAIHKLNLSGHIGPTRDRRTFVSLVILPNKFVSDEAFRPT